MILEVAVLNIKPGMSREFELAFHEAAKLITTISGYIDHDLQKCLEKSDRYILLVSWQKLEDHTIGFRQSQQYQTWKSLLHHFYEPFPEMEHYYSVLKNRDL